jgi:hypothetical protein
MFFHSGALLSFGHVSRLVWSARASPSMRA